MTHIRTHTRTPIAHAPHSEHTPVRGASADDDHGASRQSLRLPCQHNQVLLPFLCSVPPLRSRMHACTHARMHACTHARMHACTCVCVYVHAQTCAPSFLIISLQGGGTCRCQRERLPSVAHCQGAATGVTPVCVYAHAHAAHTHTHTLTLSLSLAHTRTHAHACAHATCNVCAD